MPEGSSRDLEHGDYVCLTDEPLEPWSIEARVHSPKAGAVVTFTGYTRDNFEGKKVTRLSYEAYVPLALSTLAQIVKEARQLEQLDKVAIVHLLGHSPVEWILEQVKKRCQVWKREEYEGGRGEWKENFPSETS